MNEKSESHLTSPAAFVEGGVQDACDDACSICLEAFSESDPSALTNCKHEYHLQCILEWCQRSSQCPMCWQAISLKDATSQELLEAVEQERKFRSTPSRNTTIFRHPTLGDFEIPHLSLGANDIELEERIIQHLAAAAAMGRAHHIARRESQRSRSTAQARQQNMRFSSNPEVATTGPVSSSPANRRGQNEQFPIENSTTPSVPLTLIGEESSRHGQQLPPALADQIPSPASRSRNTANHRGFSFSNMNSPSRSSSANQDGAGPSDFHSFSESLKSRLNSVSMRYKESITKGTRGWKERLFSRNTSISDLGSEVRKEVNAGLASVSRMMERLETRENSRATSSSVSNISDGVSDTDSSNQGIAETHDNTRLTERNTSISCAARSGPN